MAMAPVKLIEPGVGLSPTIPQNEAGMRIEPPVSVPMASGTCPAATAAADPLDEPPGRTLGSRGLRTGPAAEMRPVAPKPSSWRLVLPTITAPASRSSVTRSASSVATRLA
jgi:hypothetical protein